MSISNIVQHFRPLQLLKLLIDSDFSSILLYLWLLSSMLSFLLPFSYFPNVSTAEYRYYACLEYSEYPTSHDLTEQNFQLNLSSGFLCIFANEFKFSKFDNIRFEDFYSKAYFFLLFLFGPYLLIEFYGQQPLTLTRPKVD